MAWADRNCVGAAASVRGAATARAGTVHAASSAARRVSGVRGGVGGVPEYKRLMDIVFKQQTGAGTRLNASHIRVAH